MQVRWLNILRLAILAAVVIAIVWFHDRIAQCISFGGDVLCGRPSDYRLIDILVLGLLLASAVAIVRLATRSR